jgi:hypothetical protein
MRLKPPKVPTAATAAFGAAYGPRVLPGVYTVKMTKDKQTYTTQLQLIPDPRAKHSAADRKAQFDLAMKLYKLLGEMSFAVDRINDARLALEARASQLSSDDPLRKQLQTAAGRADEQRKKIVATKEAARSPAKSVCANFWPTCTATSSLTKAVLHRPRWSARTRSLANWPTW